MYIILFFTMISISPCKSLLFSQLGDPSILLLLVDMLSRGFVYFVIYLLNCYYLWLMVWRSLPLFIHLVFVISPINLWCLVDLDNPNVCCEMGCFILQIKRVHVCVVRLIWYTIRYFIWSNLNFPIFFTGDKKERCYLTLMFVYCLSLHPLGV